jgi:hypothetical protein
MQEIDMSAPGTELFPESGPQQYNSYMDVNVDQVVDDPLNTGVSSGVADQREMSDKEFNFRALREETAKLKEEREYWKGQAEAYSRQPARSEPVQASQEDAFSALDWDDSRDVRTAVETLRKQNDSLRSELSDAITAINVKAQHQDWDNMVTKHVPELTSKNPIFAEMIRNASNPYEAAYMLAELNARASQSTMASSAQVSPPSQNAQRALSNAQKPQTLSSIGGRGQLSSADYYASMTDEDFMKIASKNLAGI